MGAGGPGDATETEAGAERRLQPGPMQIPGSVISGTAAKAPATNGGRLNALATAAPVDAELTPNFFLQPSPTQLPGSVIGCPTDADVDNANVKPTLAAHRSRFRIAYLGMETHPRLDRFTFVYTILDCIKMTCRHGRLQPPAHDSLFPFILAISMALLLAISPLYPARLHAAPVCDADRARDIVGRPYSTEAAEQARRASGANSVRPSGPGIPSSADARSDRLNVLLDDARIIIGFRCG
jgi:hypothetical protein